MSKDRSFAGQKTMPEVGWSHGHVTKKDSSEADADAGPSLIDRGRTKKQSDALRGADAETATNL